MTLLAENPDSVGMATRRFRETVELGKLGSDPVTVESGLIPGVALCGEHSDNGRHYPESVLKEAAALYEGRPVYINHGEGGRGIHERFGTVVNARYEDRLRGDIRFFPSHEMAGPIVDSVNQGAPDRGMSHDVFCQGKPMMETHQMEITKIERVGSVDIVENPATNSNFFEAREDTMATTLKAFAEQLADDSPLKSEAMRLAEKNGEVELAFDEQDGDARRFGQFYEALVAEATRESDADAMMRRFRDLVGPSEQILGDTEEKCKDKDYDDEDMRKLEDRLAAVEARLSAERALLLEGCERRLDLLEELERLDDVPTMVETIRSWPRSKRSPSRRPDLAPALGYTEPQTIKAAESIDDFVDSLRS